jgi:DNA-binding MarR family transcriptional regulator
VAAGRAAVIELLFAYVERLKVHFEGVAKAHDLTPVQAKVVMSLDEPGPMRCLADELGCDPSNITGVVDRLEERGLLTRGAGPDRRTKILQSTAAGRKLREALVAELFEDVPGMERLTRGQVLELKGVLGRLCEE